MSYRALRSSPERGGLLAKGAQEAITTCETIGMKKKLSKELKKAMRGVNPQTEPRGQDGGKAGLGANALRSRKMKL